MRYFHSLIITGFLIPLLSLNAESAVTEKAGMGFIEQKEEAYLTSLDEELSLLDEEFEEFKEALYSLENDLQQREKTSPSPADRPIKIEKSQEAVADFGEESSHQMDSIALDTLSPEFDNSANKVTSHGEYDSQYQMATKTNGLTGDEETALSDAAFVSDIETAEPIKELAIDTAVNKETFSEEMIIADDTALSTEQQIQEAPAIFTVEGNSLMEEATSLDEDVIVIDLQQAFSGSPIIYSLLFAMSVIAVGIWLYSILSLRSSAGISQSLVKNLQNKLNSNNFEEALSLCAEKDTLLCKMISSGIHSRRHGLPMMIEAMKAEGKRASIAFWQKIGLLNDIAIIAPMLGLLGTVLGMFYAFYDVNRSIESVSTLFDGLGISVGTTVAGLIVAILALILHSTAKYRLVRALALVENEAQSVATLIDDRTSIYKGS